MSPMEQVHDYAVHLTLNAILRVIIDIQEAVRRNAFPNRAVQNTLTLLCSQQSDK